MEYQKCSLCGKWVEANDMDLLIGIGDVCKSCSIGERSRVK